MMAKANEIALVAFKEQVLEKGMELAGNHSRRASAAM
jgi:hypothetical protein